MIKSSDIGKITISSADIADHFQVTQIPVNKSNKSLALINSWKLKVDLWMIKSNLYTLSFIFAFKIKVSDTGDYTCVPMLHLALLFFIYHNLA